MPLLMAECERVKRGGERCHIRTSFVGSPNDIPEHWARIDGLMICSLCLREMEEPDTRETRRPGADDDG